jgi:hypothetical protein
LIKKKKLDFVYFLVETNKKTTLMKTPMYDYPFDTNTSTNSLTERNVEESQERLKYYLKKKNFHQQQLLAIQGKLRDLPTVPEGFDPVLNTNSRVNLVPSTYWGSTKNLEN